MYEITDFMVTYIEYIYIYNFTLDDVSTIHATLQISSDVFLKIHGRLEIV